MRQWVVAITIVCVAALFVFLYNYFPPSVYTSRQVISLDDSALLYDYEIYVQSMCDNCGARFTQGDITVFKNGSVLYGSSTRNINPMHISLPQETLDHLRDYIDNARFKEFNYSDVYVGFAAYINYRGRTVSIERDEFIVNIRNEVMKEADRLTTIYWCEISKGAWVEFPNDGEYCHDECNKPVSVRCLKSPSLSCDCGPDRCYDFIFQMCSGLGV